MGFITKYRIEIAVAFLIAIIYFTLRLVNLTHLPIFTDEAIYIRWAQIALQDSNWRFISLTDGKQPLFVWVAVILLKFIQDPLLAGRMVSVIGGFLSLIGIWLVAYELFKSKRIAFLSSLIYVCFPFAQVSDRMGLYDSLAGAFTLYSLYFSILLVRHARLDLAYTLGFAIGIGVLNKSTNFFGMYLLPFTLLLFDFSKKEVKNRLIKWGLLIIVAVVIAQGMYAVLRLSPLFHMVAQKNALFIYPYSEWINHPFEFLIGNLIGMTDWLLQYLTLPLALLILISFRTLKFWREKVLLFLFFLLPFVALALFARILFPRFIFFMTLSLIPLMAYAMDDIVDMVSKRFVKSKDLFKKYALWTIIIVVFLTYPLYVTTQFAIDPINARIAKPDNQQYVNYWTAGWGVKESVRYLEDKARNEKIFIGTEGTFGLMPFALEIYLVENPNVKIVGYWPLENKLPDELIQMSQKMPTFIVFYQPNNIIPPESDHLKLIMKKQAGNSKYFYRLYQVVGY